MHTSVLERMICPSCRTKLRWHGYQSGADETVDTGVVWCNACLHWYPIENGLLELLPLEIAYRDARAKFWGRHKSHLAELRLGADPSEQKTSSLDEQKVQQKHFDQYAKTTIRLTVNTRTCRFGGRWIGRYSSRGVERLPRTAGYSTSGAAKDVRCSTSPICPFKS